MSNATDIVSPKLAGVKATAIVGLAGLDEAARFFDLAYQMGAGELTAFELLPRFGIEIVLRHAEGTRDPLGEPHPWYALIELSSQREGEAEPGMETLLVAGVEQELIADGAMAASLAQADDFWRLREMLSEVQSLEGGSIKNRSHRDGETAAEKPPAGSCNPPHLWRLGCPER